MILKPTGAFYDEILLRYERWKLKICIKFKKTAFQVDSMLRPLRLNFENYG